MAAQYSEDAKSNNSHKTALSNYGNVIITNNGKSPNINDHATSIHDDNTYATYPTAMEKYTSCRFRLCYILLVAFALQLTVQNGMAFALVCMTRGNAGHPTTKGDNSTYATNSSMIWTNGSDYKYPDFNEAGNGTIFQNLIVPATQDLWAQWAPVQDKPQLLAFTYAGYNIANIITFAASGYLCTIPIDNGWPFIFYVFGCLAVLWSGLWLLTVHETPESHPAISQQELQHIARHRQGVDAGKKAEIPWRCLLTSPPVWAFIVIFFCHFWNASLLFSYLPTYMSTVLLFDVEQNGLLSAVPYITRFCGILSWTTLSSHLSERFSVTTARKTVQTLGFVAAALLTIVIILIPVSQRTVSVVLFAGLTFSQSSTVAGALVTTLDMAPQFASVITALGTAVAVVAQMLSPLTASYIIVDRTKEQWNIAFYLTVGIYLFAIIVFLIFGNGELQPWADNSCKGKTEELKEVHLNRAYKTDTPPESEPEEKRGFGSEITVTHL
ncbi:sodium-dependent phosphate transport protein 1-like isoform X3 [Haliotis rufescens]|uniref:sodium-dependent phosphate transport protein 1-like isoform X3 n=1 Tax=Haliotis rufescens TaxID=6454 RepID=UPI00201F187F|nr:sodium-dependent phosphate transport protein 1-like isoform X3 [Haliotis rufescens]